MTPDERALIEQTIDEVESLRVRLRTPYRDLVQRNTANGHPLTLAELQAIGRALDALLDAQDRLESALTVDQTGEVR